MNRIKTVTVVFTAILLLFISLISCEKYDKDIQGDICIYLLDDYNTPQSSMEILNEGLVLSDEPLISYSDIEEYDSKEYNFRFSSDAAQILGQKFGSAFAVTLEEEVIYTGYFWSGLSSAIVDWLIMDISLVDFNNNIGVQLGYPWHDSSWNIPDKRNDRRLLSVFARDGKLRD